MKLLWSPRAATRLWRLWAASWPTIVLLVLLRSVWLLAIPIAVLSVGTRVPVVLPMVAGTLFDALSLMLQQRLRRSLRTSCMVTSARDALGKQGGVPESQIHAAFWAAYVSEYAISSDLPSMLAALMSTALILVFASFRMGLDLVLPVTGVLAIVGGLGFFLHRRLRPRLHITVKNRARTADWLSAAERDAGEIGGTRSEEPFVAKVREATHNWCSAEDTVERKQIGHRFVLLLLLGIGLAFVLSYRGIDWMHLAFGNEGEQFSLRTVADVLLLVTAIPVALKVARHANALLTAYGELAEMHPPDRVPRLSTQAWKEPPRGLVVRDLLVKYGDKLALHIPFWQASFEKPVGILGPNGSGKTTFASVLGGVLAPTEGNVLVGGVPSQQIDRNDVAFVPQDPVLIEALTIEENIRLVVPLATTQQQEAILQRLGLHKSLDQKTGELSRGERRRIALARALLKESQLLILDETDAWLDDAGRRILFEILQEETKKRAVVIVSHRQEVLTVVGDVLRLDESHQMVVD
ncbi:MAG TPA: ABC transporter ATP-binding protein [Polyangiaceae bacterium]|nr:ABC transporter ATP-binding protein [Polyangiaceae bacterium]